jgi:hypothetical protein
VGGLFLVLQVKVHGLKGFSLNPQLSLKFCKVWLFSGRYGDYYVLNNCSLANFSLYIPLRYIYIELINKHLLKLNFSRYLIFSTTGFGVRGRYRVLQIKKTLIKVKFLPIPVAVPSKAQVCSRVIVWDRGFQFR